MDALEYLEREVTRVAGLLAAIAQDRSRARPPGPWSATIRAARAARTRESSDSLPFEQAARAFALDEFERDLLALCVGVECSSELAALVMRLVGGPWPTLGLVATLARLAGESVSIPSRLDRPAMRDGLFEMVGDGPLAVRGVRVAPWLVPVLAGEQPREDHLVRDGVAFDQMIGGSTVRDVMLRWATSPTRPLVIAGRPGSGRRLWVAATLVSTGMPVVAIQADRDLVASARAGRMHARWHSAGLLLRLLPGTFAGADGQAAAARLLQMLSDTPRPVALAVSSDDATVLTTTDATLLRVDIGDLTLSQRAQLWQRLLPESAGASLASDLAAAFAFRPEQVRRSVALAVDATPGAMRAACRAIASTVFSDLAERIPRLFSRSDLILPPRVSEELDLAISWIRNRHTLLEDWGFGDRLPYGRGVAALFAGRPGTGKTMAAQVLASELDMDLYRVNLARIVSKYVGETEKHLARLFEEARGAGAILFFDEADALFGKRGQVRDATDRWANLEVGYLLQRMEQHDGISVLSTNRQGDLDDAFLRRFQVSIVFPMPEAPERLRLWHRMLPEKAPREPDLPLERLAADYSLSGGDIQTAAVTAAVLAAEARTPISATHLYRGVLRVLVKNGAMPDERLLRIVRSAGGPT